MTVETVSLKYDTLADISSPEDQANKRQVWVGHVPVEQLFDIPNDENVRDFLPSAEGKQRRKRSKVHSAIRHTLDNAPHNFSILNSGVTLVADAADNNPQTKTITLRHPSVVNGTQTIGVLDEWRAEVANSGAVYPVHVKITIDVIKDQSLRAAISIASNFQNRVLPLSIAGRQGTLDDLKAAMFHANETWQLRTKESQFGGQWVDTEVLTQLLILMTPPGQELGGHTDGSFAYQRKAKCLTEFADTQAAAKDATAPDHELAVRRYKYWLDIAPQAWALYRHWNTSPAMKSLRAVKGIVRDGHSVKSVPNGITFPILAALSEFGVERRNKWSLEIPEGEFEEELMANVHLILKDYDNDPHKMGRSNAVYNQLRRIASAERKALSYRPTSDPTGPSDLLAAMRG